jgi:transposase
MLKAYRYKLEPNPSQRYALARTLDVCRELYNDCLFQRKLQPISRYEQSKQLTQLKAEFPVYKNVYSQVLQHVLDSHDSKERTDSIPSPIPRWDSLSAAVNSVWPRLAMSNYG